MVNVLDARTCQWVAEVRVEGRGGVADFAWWGDGEGMVILGKGGEAVEWDGREKRTVGRWVDEGAVGTTVVALGGRGGGLKALGGDRWLAVGSSSGVVNVYDRSSWGPSKRADDEELVPPSPKPKRAFDHLTTPTSHLEFSPDGQLLVMASQWKRDALRLGAGRFFPLSSFLSSFPLVPPSSSPLPSFPPDPRRSSLIFLWLTSNNSPSALMHRVPQLAHGIDPPGPHQRSRLFAPFVLLRSDARRRQRARKDSPVGYSGLTMDGKELGFGEG